MNAEKTIKIGYLCKTKGYEFHKNALEGTLAAAKDANIDIVYQVVGTDAAEIRKAYDAFVARGCNVIIDFSCSGETGRQIARLCEQKGILDISVDSDNTEYGCTTYFFGLDNHDAGKVLGEGAYQWLSYNGLADKVDHIIQLNASSIGEAVWDRTDDAVDIMCEKTGLSRTDNCEDIDATSIDLAYVRQKVQDCLSACRDYEQIVFFCLTSSWTPAVVAAVSAAGLDDRVAYFSVNGISETINTFREANKGVDTILKGEVATSPELYGGKIIDLVRKLMAGETCDRYNYSTNNWMTKDNVDELYPET